MNKENNHFIIMIFIFSILFCSLTPSQIHSQSTGDTTIFTIKGIGMEYSMGNFFSNQPFLKIAEFKQYINDNNVFFVKNNTHYYFKDDYAKITSLRTFISFSNSKLFLQSRPIRHELQIGLCYYDIKRYNFDLLWGYRTFRDTLINTSKLLVITDTASGGHIHYVDQYKEITFSANYIYKINPYNQFCFYEGFGIDFGMAVSSKVRAWGEYTIQSDTHSWVFSDTSSPVRLYNFNRNTYRINQTFIFNNNPVLRILFPFGFYYQLTKKQVFLNKIDLFAKAMIGIELQFNTITRKYINSYWNFSFGFIYKL